MFQTLFNNLANWKIATLAGKKINCKTKQHPVVVKPSATEYVVFDGDNTNVKTFQTLYRETLSKVDYHWVHRGNAIPNVVRESQAQFSTPPYSGKEAVDTFIAMDIIDKCHTNKHLQKVYIVSNDGDFVDVIYNASVMFPKVRFVQLVNKDRCSPASRTRSKSIKLLKRKPTSNMEIVNFKPKDKK